MRGVGCLAALALLLATAGSVQAGDSLVPTPIGRGAAYHPAPRGPLVVAQRRIGGHACSRSAGQRFGAHLELFGRGLVVIVPAGVGIAPPVQRSGASISTGGCFYPALTREPTGVIEVASGIPLTLGTFFSFWGQPLGPRRLAGFRAIGTQRVRAWVDGRSWRGDPRDVPLLPHAEIVLELGRLIPPHVSYRFEKGL